MDKHQVGRVHCAIRGIVCGTVTRMTLNTMNRQAGAHDECDQREDAQRRGRVTTIEGRCVCWQLNLVGSNNGLARGDFCAHCPFGPNSTTQHGPIRMIKIKLTAVSCVQYASKAVDMPQYDPCEWYVPSMLTAILHLKAKQNLVASSRL